MFRRACTTKFTIARRTMATYQSSSFTRTVVSAMRKLYPEQLADKSFDNTGLLLEAPERSNNKAILLTIDLTKAVADEAIRRSDSVVISYHPPIFRPLKALTLDNSQQSSLLRLAQHGISVYSPHTAVDAAPGGLNDWLADIVTGKDQGEFIDHQCSVINPAKEAPPGWEHAGYGRIVRFQEPQKLVTILQRIFEGLDNLKTLNIALPQSIPNELGRLTHPISSVGICAGSGGSMLNGLDVDMLFTGELSHHEALAAIEQGKCVVTAFHSNTERTFLRSRMRQLLEEQVKTDLMNDGLQSFITEPMIKVSDADRDPYETLSTEEVDAVANWNQVDEMNGA